MTTFPAPADPVSALTRADGTTVAHSADHGSIIDITVNAKRYLRGDGTTESASAITALQTASAGKRCYFPAGIYVWPDSTTFNMSSSTLYHGAGVGSTIFTCKNAYAFTGTSTSNVELRDFQVLPRSGATTGGIVKFAGTSINSDVHVSNVQGGGRSTITTPLYHMENTISAHLFGCQAGSGPVGFYWTAGSGFSNANSMHRCHTQNTANADTSFAGVNAGVYVASSNLVIRDSVFEATQHGYGIYVAGSSNWITIDGNWFEDNDLEHVRVVDSLGVKIHNNKFHYHTLNTLTSRHVKFSRSAANARDTHSVLNNTFQDVSPSNISVDIGANVEYTTVLGNRDANSTEVSDSGTSSLVFNSNNKLVSSMSLIDGDITLGTTTGTKIGTGTNQKLGFYAATPATRPSAYTQTYATADKTHQSFTSSDITGIASSTTGSILAEPGGGYVQAEQQQNFRRLQDQHNALKADLTDLKQLVNSIIDDLQALGLVG